MASDRFVFAHLADAHVGAWPRDAQLRQAWRIAVEQFVQRLLDEGVVAPEAEDAVACVEVEVALAATVDQIGAFAADPLAVEAERLQHASELAVEVALVERESLARALGPQRSEVVNLQLR